MDYVIHPPHVISHHFLVIKTLVLWVASSLQADVNHTVLPMPLREYIYNKYLFILFTILLSDPLSDEYYI